jgi:thymidylate synthase
MVVSAWNPKHNFLYPSIPNACHTLFQCYVRNGYLDLQLYQRSGDCLLGVPFNLASYALLIRMLAQECDLVPGKFIHTLGDCHIYVDHIEGVKKQLAREPKPLPSLTLSDMGFWERVRRDSTDDYILTGYDPHPFIKFPLAV